MSCQPLGSKVKKFDNSFSLKQLAKLGSYIREKEIRSKTEQATPYLSSSGSLKKWICACLPTFVRSYSMCVRLGTLDSVIYAVMALSYNTFLKYSCLGLINWLGSICALIRCVGPNNRLSSIVPTGLATHILSLCGVKCLTH